MQIIDIDSDDAKKRTEEWKAAVLARDGGVCVNCERKSHVAPCFIVPPEAGGRIRLSNGVTMCRDCRYQAECHRVLPTKIDNKTAINFLLSKELHASIEEYAKNSHFGGISALVRHMMQAFIMNADQFEDISFWQDPGNDAAAIKVNGWVDGIQYELFKKLCRDRNLSFTDVFKALLMIAMSTGVQKQEEVVS